MCCALYYPAAARAIDWLCRAFGFEVRLRVEGEEGRVVHSELGYGGAVVMVADGRRERMSWARAPEEVGGGNTANLMLFVDDVEAHCRRARAAGARIVVEPETSDHGPEYWTDRCYVAEDVGGHHWWFCQRLRNPPGGTDTAG